MPTESERPLICPVCGDKVSTEPPYWTVFGKYHCSDGCARVTLKKGISA